MSSNVFQHTLVSQLDRWRLTLSTAQVDLLDRHYQAMLATNRIHNLTRITGASEAALQLYADSFSVWAWLCASTWRPKTILDVGTGAGFPAFPLAVALPNTGIMAIDGRGKKIRFLKETATQLAVRNLESLQIRAEHFEPPERMDLVCFKAVGSLKECIILSKRLLNPGGKSVVFKSTQLAATEEREADSTLRAHGFVELPRWNYLLGLSEGGIRRSLRLYQQPS